jgi:predicted NodU family carbamoyl transferase
MRSDQGVALFGRMNTERRGSVTAILGVSAHYRDFTAAQKERSTRRNQDHDFPVHGIEYCLQEAGIRAERFVFIEHHESDAASALFLSAFEEVAITTLYRVGGRVTASFDTGCGNHIEFIRERRFSH